MSSEQKAIKDFTRRDLFKGAVVAGAAVAGMGAFGRLANAANTKEAAVDTNKTKKNEYNTYGEDLERGLILRSSPIGIKMLMNSKQIPSEAYKPNDDNGKKFALCQAFGMARRQGMTIAMFAEDHWCYEPIISLGLKEPPEIPGLNYLEGDIASFFIEDKDAAKEHAQNDPHLPYHEGSGMVFGPLKSISFKPDLVIIYCNTGQLRHLTLCLGYKKGYMVNSSFYCIGSCTRSTVTPYVTSEAVITVPDPGEYDRAMTTEDIMILTVPTERNKRVLRFLFEDMMEGFYKLPLAYTSFAPQMWPNFPQPDFYQALFNYWGL